MTPLDTFNATAPRVCHDLTVDFPSLSLDDMFAICGNLGHESRGFTAFQEEKPTVAGSAGGWGWGQWTGPRRRLFFAWIGNKDPKSYEANYGFLRHELQTTHTKAIAALRAAITLEDKVKAFELSYEGAGVKNYPSRIDWAKKAKNAYTLGPIPKPTVPVTPKVTPVTPRTPPGPHPPAWIAAILNGIASIFGKGKDNVG